MKLLLDLKLHAGYFKKKKKNILFRPQPILNLGHLLYTSDIFCKIFTSLRKLHHGHHINTSIIHKYCNKMPLLLDNIQSGAKICTCMIKDNPSSASRYGYNKRCWEMYRVF